MYHKIILVGRLTKDAGALRYTPNGKAVVDLTLAIDDGFGENKKTIWARVSVWEKLAENCANLKKGAMVLCECTLQHESGNPRTYKKSDGSTGAGFEFTASTVRFLSSKGEAAEDVEF
jgi:single-strand DNA-binding protein